MKKIIMIMLLFSCFVYSRNLLEYSGIVQDGVDSVVGLNGVSSIVMSHDGKYLYAGSSSDKLLVWFSRNNETGTLTYAGSIYSEDAGSKTISPDGKYLYVATKGVSYFSIDKTTGNLTYIGRIQYYSGTTSDFGGPINLEISPDGKHLYGLC